MIDSSGIALPFSPSEIDPIPSFPKARRRYPVSSEDFQDTMDGVFLSLVGVIGNIDKHGVVLSSGDATVLRTDMDKFADEQHRNTDQPLNEFAPPVFGLSSDSISDHGSNEAIFNVVDFTLAIV